MREPQPTFFPYSRPNLQIEQRHPLNHLRGKLGGRSAEIGNFANNLWAAAYENHSTICGVAAKAMRVDMGSAGRYDDERKAIMELASFVRSNELWMGWSVVTLMWCQLLDFGIPSWAGCLIIFFFGDYHRYWWVQWISGLEPRRQFLRWNGGRWAPSHGGFK